MKAAVCGGFVGARWEILPYPEDEVRVEVLVVVVVAVSIPRNSESISPFIHDKFLFEMRTRK